MKVFNTAEFNIERAIFEARFANSLISIDRQDASKLSKKFKKIFQDIQYEEDKFLNLQNKEDNINGNVLPEKIGMTANLNINLKKFQERIIQFVPTSLYILDVDKLSRIGYRVQFISSKSSMEEAIKSLLNVVNFAQNDLTQIGNLVGLVISLTTEYRNVKFKLSMIPGMSQVVEVRDGATRTERNFGVMFDCDVFQENIDQHNITEFLRDADNFLRNNVFPVINSVEVDQ